LGADELKQVEANDDVGVSLMAGEETDAIVDILREEMGDRLQVTDCITYLKLETGTGHLEVRFDEVAELLGRPFTMSEFQMIFASFYGRPSLVDDRLTVSSSMTAGVLDSDDGVSA
jgi:hypothetical protein